MRKGFTLIEIIFVIIVLGVVSSIGAEVIAKVTESFLLQKAKYSSTEKAELALEQLSNRLLYRMDLSLRAKQSGGTSIPLIHMNKDTINRDLYIGLEWIATDNDSFSTVDAISDMPGWSGFADLSPLSGTDYSKVFSTGSDFSLANTIMTRKTGGTGNAAIIFLDTPTYRNNGSDILYETNCLYSINGCIFPVSLSGSTMTFSGGDRVSGQMVYSEFYELATSAYTVISEPIVGKDEFNLFLYSNYQPWQGENFLQGTKTLLANNISVFRFKQENRTIRLKICVDEVLHGSKITSCREKAVIR